MNNWIIPNWPAPHNVKSLFTTRTGGFSTGNNAIYASLNLGAHVNDNWVDVERNRTLLRRYLPNDPKWLKQVHGTVSICIENTVALTPEGDAVFSRQREAVCAIMVADCLPVFLCDKTGTTVGIVHAGWRGLSAGIIEQTLAAMQVDPSQVMAWLGPALDLLTLKWEWVCMRRLSMMTSKLNWHFLPAAPSLKKNGWRIFFYWPGNDCQKSG